MERLKEGRLAAVVGGFRLPRYQELPDVGLYLEQVTKYINGVYAPLGCPEITSSMISNYVKKGLISSPVKKQYSAQQLAYLMFIALAKQVLSMEEINRMVVLQKQSYSPQVAYDYYCTELENMLCHVYGLKAAPDAVGANNTATKLMLRSLIVALAHVIYLHDVMDTLAGQER